MFKELFTKALLPVAITTASLSVIADTVSEKNSLEEIVVSALRINTEIAESGTSISIIDSKAIAERNYIFALDAIASASGVTINQNGAFGGQASARIRGASSEQTLVLLNGIPLNDTTSPGGGFNLNALDVDSIERIEVLKGPQSTLWGSDAIGGVINIITKTPVDGLAGSVYAELGSFSSKRIGGVVSGANETGNIRLSVSDFRTDGISKADEKDGNNEEDAYDSTNINLSGGLNIGDNSNLTFNVSRTDAETEFDSFGPATGVQDGDEVSETEQNTAQVTFNHKALDNKLSNQITLAYTDIERDNFTNGASSFSAEGERKLIRYKGNYSINPANDLTFGVEREDTESGNDEATTDSLFLLYKTSPIEDVSLTFGLRQDDHDVFGKVETGRVTAAWQLSDDLTLRSSWGQGFKSPSLFQTTFFCCGAVSANPNLLAEESDAFDVGADLNFADGKGRLSVSYFQQDTDNLITFSFPIGGYENIAKTEATGVEVDLSYAFSDQLTLESNLSYTNSEDDKGNRSIRAPRIAADLNLNYQHSDDLSLNLNAIHNGNEKDSRGTVNAWTRYDLSADYKVAQSVSVYAKVENLFDKEYQQIFGYGTPERSAYVGVKYRF